MIKGIYRNKNLKNVGFAFLKDQNSPLQCSIIEYNPLEKTTEIIHLTENQYEMERDLLKGEAR